MRIITPSRQREVFGVEEQIGEDAFVYLLSPVREATAGRRPFNQYDSREELMAAANARNCRVTWLTS